MTKSLKYDTAGNRTKLTYPDTTSITYLYDTLNRLTHIKDQLNQTIVNYTYDALKRRTNASYKNGTSTNYTYDNINRLTVLTNNYNPTPNNLYLHLDDRGWSRKGHPIDYYSPNNCLS